MRNVWMSQCRNCGWIGIDEVDTVVFGSRDKDNYDICPECWEREVEPYEVHWIVRIDYLMWYFYLGEPRFTLKTEPFWWEK